MADPFTELGLSRRPLFQMFGLPEDRGAASPLMQQAVQEDRIQQAAQMKLEQDFADLERRGQAEAAADEFVRQNPDAAMVGSSRFGDIARYQALQQRGPSYSDAVLSRSLANRLKPAARERFYQYVNEGRGVNQAFDDAEADEEDMKTRVDLVEAGLPREALARFEGQRIDPLTAAELHASLKGGNDSLADLDKYAKLLEDDIEGMKVAGLEPDEKSPDFPTYSEKLAELRQINQQRADALRKRLGGAAKPLVGAVAAGSMGAGAPARVPVTPPPAMTSEEAKKSLLQKLKILKSQ